MAPMPELDPLIHSQIRLAVLSILVAAEEAEFTYLRDRIGATDGNLGAHLLKLETAGYVAMTKTFIGRKPATLYRLTEKGRKAFTNYVKTMRRIIAADA
ncbi:MAG: transcriptional regulator [Acidobacteria bacterium]|nr:transcriptional regulator [Acidobacteriota bacterium]